MRSDSYKRNIVDYVKKNIAKGYTAETLKWALISQGYPRSIVEIAMETAQKEIARTVPVLKEKPVIKYEVVEEEVEPKKKSWLRRLFGL